MDQFCFYLRILISFVLFSSGITHIINKQKFIYTVRSYKILPQLLIKPTTFLITYVELILGGFLAIGLLQKYILILVIVLFTCFNITILINLIRGNRNLDCGCGGILGDQQISWKIIIRNLLFIFALYFLITLDINYSSVDSLILGSEKTFDSSSFLIIFLAISTLFIFSTYINLLKIKNKFLEFK